MKIELYRLFEILKNSKVLKEYKNYEDLGSSLGRMINNRNISNEKFRDDFFIQPKGGIFYRDYIVSKEKQDNAFEYLWHPVVWLIHGLLKHPLELALREKLL